MSCVRSELELFLKLCKLQKKNSLFFQIMAKWLEQWDRSQGLEFVPLTISYHLYFLWISKVLSMLHHGSVEYYFIFKECYFILTYAFLALFWSFWSKKFCFYNFHFIFWWSIEFLQKNINQSETRIGDKKLNCQWNCISTADLCTFRALSYEFESSIL